MMRDQHGTTMVELLVVAAISAVLVKAGTITAVEMYDEYIMHGASQQVFTDLQSSRLAAQAENNRYSITLRDGHTYLVHDDDDNNEEVDEGETVTVRDLGTDWNNVTVALSGAITFLPDGTTLATESATLRYKSYARRAVTVSQGGRVAID